MPVPGTARDTVEEGLLLTLIEPFLDALDFRPTLFKLGPGNDFGQLGQGRGRIVGGPGNDRMIGLDGRDILIGGPGKDVLDSQASGGSIDLNGGRDRYLGRPRGGQDQGPRLHPRPADLLRPGPRHPQPRPLRPEAERLPLSPA